MWVQRLALQHGSITLSIKGALEYKTLQKHLKILSYTQKFQNFSVLKN